MRIDIMSKYQVKYKNKCSQRIEYNVFKPYTCKWDRKLNGGELIDLIARIMQESNFLEIVSNESEIHISLFSPDTGESEDITIQYTRLEK